MCTEVDRRKNGVKGCMNEKDMERISLQTTNQEGRSNGKANGEAQQLWEHDSYITCPVQLKTPIQADDLRLEANQLNEGSEYESYVTIATIEKGPQDNGQGTEINRKGMTYNIHVDKQKEETPRARITKTSPVQIKMPVQAEDPLHLHCHYEEEDTKKVHTMLKCM